MRSAVRTLVLAAVACIAALPALAATVGAVNVEGTRRVESATVVSYAGLRPGDALTDDAIADAVEAVFASGLFSDVTITRDGGAVTIRVVENPVISRLAFEGNDKLSDEDLTPEIALAPRQVLSRPAVAADTERLAELYRRRGHFAATITPQVIMEDDGRANLVFEIDEGPRARISRIAFVGNAAFSDGRLRQEIVSRQQAWFRFWTALDKYDPDRARFDEEQLVAFYNEQGFADMAVLSSVAELSADRTSFILTFTIDEGERYRVSGLTLSSALEELPDADFLLDLDAVRIAPGDWYNAARVAQAEAAMVEALAERNIIFVDVRGGLLRDAGEVPEGGNPTGTVAFRLTPAPEVYIERIEITGNTRTHDDVIRREIDVVEGDPLNRTRLDAARRRVSDLGYFAGVDTRVKPGSTPGQRVVEVAVVEQSTGDISVGVGYSTIDGALADVRLRERNLLGRGYIGSIGASVSQDTTEFDLSLADPHFLDRDLLAGFTVFHRSQDLQDESSFDLKSTGGRLNLGFPLSARWRQTLGYRLEDREVSDVQADASRYIEEQEGTRLTSAISSRWTYDARDSRLRPTEGFWYWLDMEVAGIGGDAEYVSGQTGATGYYSIMPDWIVAVTGEGGAIEGYNDDEPNIAERYYMGGRNMRGFERGGLGPRDLSTDDALGGKYFLRSTVELTTPMPLFPEEYGIRGHVFTDAGTLWGLDDGQGAGDPNVVDDLNWRASVGVGLSWDSPMGPIRVDLAEAVVKEDYDKDEVFRFSFGSSF